MNKIIITFITFCLFVLICRHIVSDVKQNERMDVLEQKVENLYFASANKTEGLDKTKGTDKTDGIDLQKEKQQETHKFMNPIMLELNVADSATLVKVPGIGAKSASMIISYREKLGGFYSPRQILEKLKWDSAKERMDEWQRNWLKADERLIKKIDINKADFKELLKHPYLNYEQTKAIVNYRDKHRHIESIAVFSMFDSFVAEDIERLSYYISFSD